MRPSRGAREAAGFLPRVARHALHQTAIRERLARLAELGVPTDVFPGEIPLTGDPGPDEMFSARFVYQRGALTLHALRREVGDDRFFAILREWTARYRNANATTADFVALAEEVSGRELDVFFDGWLFQAAVPRL